MSVAVPLVAWLGAAMALTAGLLLFGRLRGLPPARVKSRPRVSVIIPARDEEVNLRKLLPALVAQTVPPHEIIVVDDQSTDGTATIARAAGATVVAGQELPNGWFGKPWACHQGAELATGEWLWFLDADVEPQADALERLSGMMDEGVVISVCPWHRIERNYEAFSVFFNLLMVGGIGASTWRGDEAPGIGLFGQCLLIPRRIYDAVGGHGAVRRAVLENFELSRLLEQAGVRRLCRGGQGSIAMRMFPDGVGQLCQSWVKGFASGADLSPKTAMVLCSFWLSGLMMLSTIMLGVPLAGLAGGVVAGMAYLATAASLVIWFRRVGGFPWWWAMLFPLPLGFYLVLFSRSVQRRRSGQKTSWKGRDVD